MPGRPGHRPGPRRPSPTRRSPRSASSVDGDAVARGGPGRRDRGPGRAERVGPPPPRRVRRPPRRPPRRRDVRMSAALRFGCISPGRDRAAAARSSRRGAVPPPALLARLLRAGPRRPGPTRRGPTTAAAATSGTTTPSTFRAWTEGRTGYPVVDAAMRQLRARGLHAQPGPHDRRRRSSPRTCTSTGGSAPGTSSTGWSTARSRTTTSTGSGPRAPAPTPTRTGSSTRPCRPNASIPTATTCAATSRSSPRIPGGAVHEPWNFPPRSGPPSTTRSRSSTTARRSRSTRRPRPSSVPGARRRSARLLVVGPAGGLGRPGARCARAP